MKKCLGYEDPKRQEQDVHGQTPITPLPLGNTTIIAKGINVKVHAFLEETMNRRNEWDLPINKTNIIIQNV